MTKGFLRWGKLVSKQIKPEDFEQEHNVWSGEEAMGILSTYCDMTSENFQSFRGAASKLASANADVRETRWRAKRTDVLPAHALSTMQGFVRVCELLYARNVTADDDDRVRDNASHYRLVLIRTTTTDPSSSSSSSSGRKRRRKVDISYGFFCVECGLFPLPLKCPQTYIQVRLALGIQSVVLVSQCIGDF